MGGIDLCPRFYDGKDLSGGEICESEVVRGGEGENVAFSCYGFGAEEGI